jgi:hypothetical protein
VYKSGVSVVPTNRRSTICCEEVQLIKRRNSAEFFFWRGTDRGARGNRRHDSARLWFGTNQAAESGEVERGCRKVARPAAVPCCGVEAVALIGEVGCILQCACNCDSVGIIDNNPSHCSAATLRTTLFASRGKASLLVVSGHQICEMEFVRLRRQAQTSQLPSGVWFASRIILEDATPCQNSIRDYRTPSPPLSPHVSQLAMTMRIDSGP